MPTRTSRNALDAHFGCQTGQAQYCSRIPGVDKRQSFIPWSVKDNRYTTVYQHLPASSSYTATTDSDSSFQLAIWVLIIFQASEITERFCTYNMF